MNSFRQVFAADLVTNRPESRLSRQGAVKVSVVTSVAILRIIVTLWWSFWKVRRLRLCRAEGLGGSIGRNLIV